MVLRYCDRCDEKLDYDRSMVEMFYPELIASSDENAELIFDLCPKCRKDFLVWMRGIKFQREMEAKDGHN